MPFFLDMKTIFITLVVGHFLTMVLISAYWRDHRKDKILSTYFLAKCLQATAWLLLALRGGIPDFFTISLANSMLFLGTSLETVAILKYLQVFNSRLKRIYRWLTSFIVFGFHFILFFKNGEHLRIAFASFGNAAFVLLPTFHLFTKEKNSLLGRIMAILFSIVMISLVGRGVGALLTYQSVGLFTPGLHQTLSFLAIYLVMILGNTGFILLLKERTDEELIYLASYDDLTKTLNRKTFISKAEKTLCNCAKGKQPLSFILFDVDHFKTINDTYGHDAGDRVLRDLSEKISQQLGPSDLFGRYGGDEFAILLTGLEARKSYEVAEAVRKRIEQSTVGDQGISYTLSIGLITVVPDLETNVEALYIACDNALYGAKRNGRNNVYEAKLA